MKLVQHDHCKDSSFVYTADGRSVYLSRPFAVPLLIYLHTYLALRDQISDPVRVIRRYGEVEDETN